MYIDSTEVIYEASFVQNMYTYVYTVAQNYNGEPGFELLYSCGQDHSLHIYLSDDSPINTHNCIGYICIPTIVCRLSRKSLGCLLT